MFLKDLVEDLIILSFHGVIAHTAHSVCLHNFIVVSFRRRGLSKNEAANRHLPLLFLATDELLGRKGFSLNVMACLPSLSLFDIIRLPVCVRFHGLYS